MTVSKSVKMEVFSGNSESHHQPLSSGVIPQHDICQKKLCYLYCWLNTKSKKTKQIKSHQFCLECMYTNEISLAAWSFEKFHPSFRCCTDLFTNTLIHNSCGVVLLQGCTNQPTKPVLSFFVTFLIYIFFTS